MKGRSVRESLERASGSSPGTRLVRVQDTGEVDTKTPPFPLREDGFYVLS